MSKNLLDQLADIEVPAPPSDLDRRVHQRLNVHLLSGQYIDFITRGLPYTLLHLVQPLVALVSFTLTGRHNDKSRKSTD